MDPSARGLSGLCARCGEPVPSSAAVELETTLHCSPCADARHGDTPRRRPRRNPLRAGKRRGPWRPLAGAIAYARSLGLRDVCEWFAKTSADTLPVDIPADPAKCAQYRDEWPGFGVFLGTGVVAYGNVPRVPFAECVAFARVWD